MLGLSERMGAPRGALRGFAVFLAVGLAGLATDAMAFTAMTQSGAGLVLARAVSMIVATIVTWQLNRHLTFVASARSALDEGARYTLVALLAQGSSYLSFILLCHAMPAVPPLVFLVACSGSVAVFSFLGQQFFTFRQP